MSDGKVIHEVDRWSGGRRYEVQTQDLGDWRWDYNSASDSEQVAIGNAERLVHEQGFGKARVVDTEREEE